MSSARYANHDASRQSGVSGVGGPALNVATGPDAESGKCLRIAVLQRVCPAYRVRVFAELAHQPGVVLKLLIGADLPNSKVRSAPDLHELPVQRMDTVFVRVGRRVLPWHRRLVRGLVEFEPDVIVCEGESHFLGYLQAMWYRFWFNRKVALVHWCFIALPGEPERRRDVASLAKWLFHRFFDAFLVYSTYSRDRLRRRGVARERVFVAVNVGNVERIAEVAARIQDERNVVRQQLHLEDRLTVVYAGTLNAVKRPEVLLALARMPLGERCQFILLGEGDQFAELAVRREQENLANVTLLGRVSVEEMVGVFRAADLLIMPGRGGIVLSEALAAGLPALVHEADGTEYDLILEGVTGWRVATGDVRAFADAIDRILASRELLRQMGENGRRLVGEVHTTKAMARAIVDAARFASELRAR